MIALLDTATTALGWGHSHGKQNDWKLDSKEFEKHSIWLFTYPVKGGSVIDKLTRETTGQKKWNLRGEIMMNADTRKVAHKQRASADPGKHESYVDPVIEVEGYLEDLIEELEKLGAYPERGEMTWEEKERDRQSFKMHGVYFSVQIVTWQV